MAVPVDNSLNVWLVLLRFTILYVLIATPGVIAALDLAKYAHRTRYALRWAGVSVFLAVIIERGCWL